MDDVTDKEILVEIFKEVRAIRRFIDLSSWLGAAIGIAVSVGTFTA